MNLRVRTVHVFVSPMAFRSPPAPEQELLRPARRPHPSHVRRFGQSTRALPRIFRARVVRLVVPNPTLCPAAACARLRIRSPRLRSFRLRSRFRFLPSRSTSSPPLHVHVTFRHRRVHVPSRRVVAAPNVVRSPFDRTHSSPFERKASGSVHSFGTQNRNPSKGGGGEKETRERKETHRIVPPCLSLTHTNAHTRGLSHTNPSEHHRSRSIPLDRATSFAPSVHAQRDERVAERAAWQDKDGASADPSQEQPSARPRRGSEAEEESKPRDPPKVGMGEK